MGVQVLGMRLWVLIVRDIGGVRAEKTYRMYRDILVEEVEGIEEKTIFTT
jgi:hypothetical protein